MKTREEDFVSQLIVDSTHAYLLCFTNTGRVYWLKVYEIPDVGAAGKGKSCRACSTCSRRETSAPFCPSAISKKKASSSSSPRARAR
jgi:DNA gyrase subunit A